MCVKDCRCNALANEGGSWIFMTVTRKEPWQTRVAVGFCL
jgi:hypothetical protein